jgi:hypothetical protein
VDDHVYRRASNHQDQQDYRLATKSIAHHHPTEDQDQAPQGPIDQSQGHHRDQ